MDANCCRRLSWNVQLLHKYGYVTVVNWDTLGNDTSTQIHHWAANVDVSNVEVAESISLRTFSWLVRSAGLALGLLAGFLGTH